MTTRRKVLPAACCIALLSACASERTASMAPLPFTTKTASANHGLSADVLYKMGRYYQGQNRYDLALNAYQNSLAADSRYVEARNGLGVIYSQQGKYHEAVEAFQIAVQQQPNAAHIYSNMGYAYYLQGNYKESVSALEQATLLDPKNQRAFNNLGLAYAKAGIGSESVQAFKKAANIVAETTVVPAVASEASSQHQVVVTENAPTSNVTLLADKHINTVSQPVEQSIESHVLEQLVLSLPKDRGAIKQSSDVETVPVIESRVKLVQSAPNVTELHAAPVMTTSVSASAYLSMVKFEVANGNGVTGMAGKVGRFLQSHGMSVTRLTNQKPFQVRNTQIQYREGYEAEAQLLKASLPESPELVSRNDLRGNIGVRLVLGKDLRTYVAYFNGKKDKLQMAVKNDKFKS